MLVISYTFVLVLNVRLLDLIVQVLLSSFVVLELPWEYREIW